MKNLIIGVLVLVALWFTLPFIGIDAPYVIPNLIEWATKFVLPWVFLYWIIRVVKTLEKKE